MSKRFCCERSEDGYETTVIVAQDAGLAENISSQSIEFETRGRYQSEVVVMSNRFRLRQDDQRSEGVLYLDRLGKQDRLQLARALLTGGRHKGRCHVQSEAIQLCNIKYESHCKQHGHKVSPNVRSRQAAFL